MGLWDKLKGRQNKPSDASPPFVQAPGPKLERPEAPKRETGTRKRGETGVRKKGETGTRLRDHAAYAKRGKERLNSGDFDGAIADYSKAIEMNPEFVDAYAQRGVAREHKGDMQGAKADYSKSIEIQIRAEIKRQLDAQEESQPSPGV